MFDRALWINKLSRLVNTLQSIQTVSQWALFYSVAHASLVELWFAEYAAANAEHRLVMLYLCNDIVQNSRKESPVFVQEFGKYLAEALRLFYSDPMANEMQKSKISRILNVWLEREVYSTEFIQSLKGVTNNTQTVVHQIPVIDHKAVKSPGGASASGPGNLQTNNPLVKLYLEFERESVNDALVSIEAEDCVRDILGHADIASVKELEQAQTVLAHYKDRLTSCLQKREKIIQNLQESLERETRALKQNGKDVQECEKNLEQIQALLDGKSNLTPRKRSIS